MKTTAFIGEKEYHEIERLQQPTSDGLIVICSDAQGNRFACPAVVWDSYISTEIAPCFAAARKFGSGLLTRAMEKRHELKFKSYDRLFPNQDTIPKGGFGNLIALPLQGQARKDGNSLFIDESFIPYSDQWTFLSTVSKVSAERLNK